ncbi:MAG TPA: insulinase family protein [Cellulomonas sp.]
MSIETDLTSMNHLAGLVDTATVDGVPTLLSERDGPVTGGLMFRVGRDDETLASAGITHLVEHLALYPLNMWDLHHNGQTAGNYTLFHATGTPADVVDFLNGVCAVLRNLPLDRLEVEKAVLRTEAAGSNGGGAFEAMGLWRYGVQGPGLSGPAHEGLALLTADDVAAWACTRFTRDNAVLFLTAGALPQGLDLRLPAGRRFPILLPQETLVRKPAWFPGPAGAVVIDGLVARGTAASLFARTAERTLFRVLRQERGLSYTVTCSATARTHERTQITVHADALPEKQDAMVRTVVGTLDALRDGGVQDMDLAAARKLLRQEYDTPHLGAVMLPGVAFDLLVGHPTLHPDEARARLEANTAADVTAIAAAFWDDALAEVPNEGLDWAGFVPAPRFSPAEVIGRAYPRYSDPGTVLLLGDQGVSLRMTEGVHTVRYEDCALMWAYADGGRVLVGRDGFQVVVEPTLHRRLTPEMVAATIDPHVPRAVVRVLPERPADRIPRPARWRKEFRVAPQWRGLGQWAVGWGVCLVTLGVLWTLALIPQRAPADASAALLALFWLFAAVVDLGGAFLLFAGVRRRAL